MRFRKYTVAITALALWAGSSRAGMIRYNSRAAFQAATNGTSTIDFEGFAPDGGFISGVSFTFSGVTFTQSVSRGALFVIGRNVYYSNNSVLSAQHGPSGPTDLEITLPGGYTAIGMDVGSFRGSTFTFTLSTGDVFTRPTQFNLGFVGVTTSTPITSIRIDSPDLVMNVDNFTFGQAVPEPASLMLFGIGTLCLLGRRCWRRCRPALT
jgi:hypothetical protein